MPKKGTKRIAEVLDEEASTSVAVTKKATVGDKKTVIIEHCAFKTRAAKIEKALKASGVGVDVKINEEKPRKGAFVVSIVGEDKPRIELLDLPRPFTKLKNLDLDKEIATVIEALSA